MRILVQRGEAWVAVDQQAYAQEELLERLIHESPDVIPLEPGAERVVYARQFACPPNYAIDLVGVGTNGSVTIVECKLDRNRESRRDVIGQVLEYAAGLWGMPIEEFEGRFIDADGRENDGLGRSPFDLLQADATPANDLRGLVAQNLETGRFRLIIAVDAISDQLQAIIRYLNAHSGGQLKLVALALPEFSDGIVRILVPETFGDEAPPVTTQGPGPAVPLEVQIGNAREDWRPAIWRMHEVLSSLLAPQPQAKHIYYVDDATGKRILDLWPRDGRMWRGRTGQSSFDQLMVQASELGVDVGKDSIRFVTGPPAGLAEFTQRVRTWVSQEIQVG